MWPITCMNDKDKMAGNGTVSVRRHRGQIGTEAVAVGGGPCEMRQATGDSDSDRASFSKGGGGRLYGRGAFSALKLWPNQQGEKAAAFRIGQESWGSFFSTPHFRHSLMTSFSWCWEPQPCQAVHLFCVLSVMHCCRSFIHGFRL